MQLPDATEREAKDPSHLEAEALGKRCLLLRLPPHSPHRAPREKEVEGGEKGERKKCGKKVLQKQTHWSLFSLQMCSRARAHTRALTQLALIAAHTCAS